MNGRAYYNEHDPKAAAWLRDLIAQSHIAAGEVDERSIVDVRGDDLRGFTQCHFFAGIGVWSYALRRAGWPDDRPVWTGSCPCQPFSAAGKRQGEADTRHLWPELFRLIQERSPVAILGEQVASPDGLAWLDTVLTDLEGADYAAGAVDICAAGFGAPHIRQRLYWMADSAGERWLGRRTGEASDELGSQQRSERLCDAGIVGDAERPRLERHAGHGNNSGGWPQQARPIAPAGVVGGFWSGAELIWCRDEKWRPVEPGTFPLANGAPARVGRLRGYGNAIVATAAEEFIKAIM